ncbi:phage tail sheath C-terminal domain-containing protein [Mucilaginibacter sp. L3T2-6]|uniref:phage tail sheath family protein n=1 Tax=Mucilaginibacter sp. L3T2-6 TaxID=3062491 RepID=UPI0026771E8F|nr:phage tail sheath C-terminal domain-containing protein [Mucilaginibacter sp. L3T2-6]MDO3641545.1 phage tail sheath C-terminal domain-containing protein [Mucilaginibacter sp. L3T2-6]MDV6214039.1 phage tail sheath C-terminal domain-containing protein [Mucilaginibacter sp. L3T2-6]
MATYHHPGVYVEEVSLLPPSVAEVETAIPAFIGYTQKTTYNGQSLINKPVRIKSLKEYEQIFGDTDNVSFNTTGTAGGIKINKDANGVYSLDAALADPSATIKFRMYYCLQLYFANGGGPCYIASAGATSGGAVSDVELGAAMDAVQKEDEPTVLIYTDAIALTDIDKYYGLYTAKAMAQAALLKDRVVLVDLYNTDVATFRTKIGNNNLSYAAAYYPNLRTTIPYKVDEASINIIAGTNVGASEVPANAVLRLPEGTVNVSKSIYHNNGELYNYIKQQIGALSVTLPPASAIAGVYATVDSTRGVWKAPANVSLNMVIEPAVKITDADQDDLNVTGTGKSINAIRTFTGKGVLVWGARTLAGNDNEWRYISVRRFFNMVEESVKKATEPFVFEPNDGTTWSKIRGMIANFLTLQWRAGALQGAKPEDAFFVHVGLGETMTALDILEGRLIVEVGMAVVRPAEFIILRFSHKLVQS